MNDFLPINKKEMLERGWQDVDFVFVTGDSSGALLGKAYIFTGTNHKPPASRR